MRCPKCFEKVVHDKLFDVYDCPSGCSRIGTAAVSKCGFDREEVLTEAEFQKYLKGGRRK